MTETPKVKANPAGATVSKSPVYDVEKAVLERYQAGATTPQASLCCPTEYDNRYLEHLPSEILEKDYGCGDPTRYVEPGETVLDLGSGVGKNCYILAQKVGVKGQVIGVDFNEEMLAVARKYQLEMANILGCHNVRFLKGKIQDLALNLDLAERWLKDNPIHSFAEIAAWETECDRLRREHPLIPDEHIDLVVSNCVLNLVRPQDKQQLFQEIYRVLKPGGRVVISDIVCDEPPTPEILADPELWSGCVAGAFQESEFLEQFAQAGFYGMEILERSTQPWQVIDGIEFRSLTVRAFKGKDGPCLERNQAVIYKGPWKQVMDDEGHILYRGQRMAVCDKTLRIYTSSSSPYSWHLIPVEPYEAISLETAQPFNPQRSQWRHPRETKGVNYQLTDMSNPGCCSPE